MIMRFPAVLIGVFALTASANAQVYCSEIVGDCSDRIEFGEAGEVTIISGERIWRGVQRSSGTPVPFRIIDSEDMRNLAYYRHLDDNRVILSFNVQVGIYLTIYHRQNVQISRYTPPRTEGRESTPVTAAALLP